MSKTRENGDHIERVVPIIRDSEYYFQKGIELFENKQEERALRFMERAMAADPKEPTYVCHVAILLSEMERYEESNTLLTYVLEQLDPENAECYFFRANNFIGMSQFEQALFELTLYVQTDPSGQFVEDAEAYMDLLDEHDQAKNETAAVAEVRPETALRLLVCGEFEAAEEAAKRQIEEEPEESRHYAYLAESFLEQKRMADAEEIIFEWPDLSYGLQMHCLLARFLYEKNELTREEAAARVSKLYPLNLDDYYYWGRTLLRFHEFDLAYKTYLRIKFSRQTVKDHFFFHELALLVWYKSSVEEAEQIWQSIQQKDENHPPIVEHMLALVQKGEFPLDIETVLPYA